MKKILVLFSICFILLGVNVVKADTGITTSAYSRLNKVYNHSYYKSSMSYGYHGTDYDINGALEVYAEIRVEGQTTRRVYGTRSASVRAFNSAYQNINHSHHAGGS